MNCLDLDSLGCLGLGCALASAESTTEHWRLWLPSKFAMPPEAEVEVEGSPDSHHCVPDSDALAEPS